MKLRSKSILRVNFLLPLLLMVLSIVDANQTYASVGPDDITAFRLKNEKILIDKLKDLDQQSDDVKGISAKIDELRAKGYAMLDQVPAHKRTCAIKVKHRVNVIMERATEETDQCIASNVDSPPNHDLNSNQKDCLFEVLREAALTTEKLHPFVVACIDNVE